MAWSDHFRYDKYLYIHPAETIFKARVDQGSFTYPLATVDFDDVTVGAFGDILPGMTILFGSTEGASDLGRQRVRASATSTVLKIGWSSRGIRDGEVNLADDAYITVLDDYRAWAKIPRITNDGTLYKDFEIAAATGTPSPPVANGGVGVLQFIDSVTSLITVDFDGTDSFVTAPGASISTYAWDFVDGTPASSATSTENGVTFPLGFRWVTLTVTDDNGKTHTTHIPVVALGETGGVKNYFTEFEVTNQTLTRNGQNISFMIYEAMPAGTYYDGALVMYGEDEYYNDVKGSLAGPTGRENGKFIGWHNTDTASLEASESTYITSTEFSCVDIGGRMRQLPAFPQAVLRDTSPSTWLQLKSANTDRYVHYLLHWHSTVLDVSPFTWSGTGDTYALPRFQSPGQSLFEQLNFRAASIAHVLTVTMRGQLSMTPDPQLQDSGDRTNTVITDIDPADWMNVGYTHQRPPRTYWLWGNAVVANTQEADASNLKINAVFCVAPGKAPGQGGTEQTHGEQLVANQTELNAREGHRYAVRLNPFETFFDIAILHPGDIGIDPALMEWVRLTITSDLAAQRGLSFTDERFLPFELDIVHNNITQTKELFLRAEREREGTPAATVVPETGDIIPDTPDIDDWPYVWEDETGAGLFRGQSTIAAFDTGENLYITNDFNTPEASGGPTWTTIDLTALSPALAGNILSMVGDPFSPLYLGTGSTANGWILTDTSIYSITDIFGVSGGPTLALQHTLVSANANFGFIATGVGVQNWVVAVVHYNSAGTTCIYTTTGGATWAESNVSPYYDSVAPGNIDFTPPIFVSSSQAGLVYAGTFTATQDDPPGGLYKSTDYGANWAAAATPAVSFGELNGGTFVIPWHDNGGQLLSYWTKDFAVAAGNTSISLGRTETDGVTITDITPSESGVQYGVRYWWALSVCPIDRQRVAITGVTKEATPHAAIWVSKDAGDTWTRVTDIVLGSNAFRGCAIAGNDTDVIYAWGANLQISYSQDFGQTFDDKTANLAGSDIMLIIIGG